MSQPPRNANMVAAVQQAEHDGRIRAATARSLIAAIKAMEGMCGSKGFAAAIVNKPELLLRCIGHKWPNAFSKQHMIAACTSALKWDPSLGTEATRRFWRDALAEAGQATRACVSHNVLSDREKAAMPSFDAIKAAIGRLNRGTGGPHVDIRQSLELLWLLIALKVPAKRADYGQLGVVSALDKVPGNANAMVVPRSTGGAVLVLQSYKTQHIHGRYEEEMPPEVTQAIRASLAAFPRSHLFVAADGAPFKSNATWAQWATRTFEKHLGNRATVNGLRKAWVQMYGLPGKVTHARQVELARAMLHSHSVQQAFYVHVDGE